MPPKRCINVHCAPLPRYGGMSPYVWALANNEDHSAATIHYMEEGLDVGDIIVQEKIDVVKFFKKKYYLLIILAVILIASLAFLFQLKKILLY